ncbi:MAG TPA: hypothetical protein VMW27_27790 [Thermoanaerobaculia bacterium]|nr:hypothetical protein [Thermoanaerobaculia bacterium]
MKKSLKKTERKKLVLHRETILYLQQPELREVIGRGPTGPEVPFDSTIAVTGCC